LKLNRSPLFYVGDKFKLANQILPLFPEKIGTFVEPFAGGGSIALNTPAERFVLNDFNPYVSNLHKWLQTQKSLDLLLADLNTRLHQVGLKSSFFGDEVSISLKEANPKTYFAKQNKSAYESLRATFNSSNKTNMLDFYLLLIFGFNRMIRFNSSGEFNVPVGNVDLNKNVVNALEAYINWANTSNITVSNTDYADTISKSNLRKDGFVYVDPPYLIAQTEYNKSWSLVEERRLLKTLDELNSNGIKWALSNVTTYKGASNETLITWAKKFNVTEIKANYINYHDNGDKKPGEVLVRNYD
jgi:DNA adenine methylase